MNCRFPFFISALLIATSMSYAQIQTQTEYELAHQVEETERQIPLVPVVQVGLAH